MSGGGGWEGTQQKRDWSSYEENSVNEEHYNFGRISLCISIFSCA